MKYRFYVTYNGDETEVHPLGVDKLKTTAEVEDGRIFLREKLEGKLTFINDDYAYFKAIDDDDTGRCDEISIRITQSCDKGVTYSDFYNGYFSTTDGTFDIDRCIFTVEVQPDDDYRCFIEGLKTEISFNEVSGQTSSSGNVPDAIYEYYVCRNTVGNCNASRPSPSPTTTWLPFHTETTGSTTTTIYYREVAVIPCEDGVAVAPVGAGWVQDTGNPPSCATEGLSRWVRIPQTVVTYNPNPDVIPGFCDNGTPVPAKPIYVTKSNSTPDPIILGKEIVQVTSTTTEYYYVKHPKTNATYSWGITGSGNSISSGGSTSAVTVSIQNNGSVTVTETTPCGASSTVTQTFTTCAGSGCSEYNDDVEIVGNLEICVGETADYYLNGETGRIAIISGGTGTATISATQGQGTHGNFSLTGLTVGTVTVIWNGGAARDSLNTPGITVTVVAKKTTPTPYGATSVCKSDVTYYEISDSDSGVFTWYVEGGTITSGQGTYKILVTWDGSAGEGIVAVRNASNCGCDWVQIADCGYNGEPPFYYCQDNSETFSINFLLQNAINSIKDEICPDINDVRSDFFQWNPVGDTPGYVSGTNYVTNDVNKIKYISIVPTFDILYIADILAGTKVADTKTKISWEFIEKLLFEVFNCFWFIENGYVRIEHYSWFLRTVHIDLTGGNYLQYIKGKNIYYYDKIEAPRFERFKWNQSLNTDFVGAEISYSGSCVNLDPLTNVSEKGATDITTDIIFLLSGDNAVNDGGFTLMANDYDGAKYTLSEEAGLISGLILPNAHLSWANLHYNYHRHGRVLLEGRMNLQAQVFLSAIRFKKQDSVKFPFCCSDTLNPVTDLVKTSVGNGQVIKYEFDLKSDTMTVNLAHDL